MSIPNLHQHAWIILDTEDQWSTFSQSVQLPTSKNAPVLENPADMVQSQFMLDGLRCAACSGIIEQGLLAQPGIASARVSLSKSRAEVVWSPAATKPSNILKAIEGLGYSAMPATNLGQQKKNTATTRAAFWRWMVAGFCMMQVMMYASPSYFTKLGEITTDIRQLLNWASWLLSLPVVLFSSRAFFSNAWRDLTHRQISMDLPVALGILMTFIVSSAVTFDPNGWWGNVVYFDSLTMFVFFLLSARLIEAKLHNKTMGALETLVSRIPESTSRQNADGSFSRILNSQLNVGDIVRVNIGEAFPADGMLITGNTRVDESLLTGESTPIHKNQQDLVIAGSYNLGKSVDMQVNSMGESTQYGQIVNLINQAAIEKPRLSQLVDRIAKPFLLFVILSATITGAALWHIDHGRALMTAAAVLIVTCPCALSLATPAAMLASASAFVKKGILIKRLQAIENIADIDTVIFDKTGTLTEDHIQVDTIVTREGISEAQALSLAQALAQHSSHPISRAILAAQDAANPSKTSNVLFSSDKLNSVLSNIHEEIGAGIQGHIANQAIFAQGEVKLGSAQFCETQVTDKTKQQVYLTDQLGWVATFNLTEVIKQNAAITIMKLKKMRLNIELLSGDQSYTVSETAKRIGIETYRAACNPQDKLNRLVALKIEGKKILMVGDGLNDGPILASAHVAIAMGKGVPLTQAHADYIFLNGDISQIPALVVHAQKTMRIIKQNIIWAIIYNFICIPLAIVGVLSAWLAGLGMALSSLIVICNALRLTQFKTTNLNQEVF